MRGHGPGGSDGTLVVDCPDFVLSRRIEHAAGAVVADYRLSADPGYRFVWAGHALLDLSPAARLVAPAGTPTRLLSGGRRHPWRGAGPLAPGR